MNEPTHSNPTPMAGSKLSTIFLVVLGLHIVLIVAFSAYHLLKGDSSADAMSPGMADTEQTLPSSNPTDAGATSEQPTVETVQNDPAPGMETPGSEAASLPMPASNDPIWTRVPAAEERNESVSTAVKAPPFSQAPRVEMTVNEKTHTVAKGDSLARIARIYNITVVELKAANNMSTDLIKVGQTLQLPSVQSLKSAPVNVASVKAPASPVLTPVVPPRAVEVGSSYTVGKGDTLWNIARKFNVKPQELAAANGITDPSKLKIGTVLRLPGNVEKQDLAQPPAKPQPVPGNTDMAMAPREN
jgi:LysM repeat protein